MAEGVEMFGEVFGDSSGQADYKALWKEWKESRRTEK